MNVQGITHQSTCQTTKTTTTRYEWIRRIKRVKWSPKVRKRIVESQNNICAWKDCRRKLDDVFELDHRIALSQGGIDEETNLQALHLSCHFLKTCDERRRKKEEYDKIKKTVPKKKLKKSQQDIASSSSTHVTSQYFEQGVYSTPLQTRIVSRYFV